MESYRQELDEVMRLKQVGGFHYIRQAQQLTARAKQARHWRTLLRTPPTRWPRVWSETRTVLSELQQ